MYANVSSVRFPAFVYTVESNRTHTSHKVLIPHDDTVVIGI